MSTLTKDILEKIYLERREKRPNYSMRAFARDLAISPGGLHQVLNGKALSFKRAIEIARRLDLSKRETERFILSVQISKIDDPEYREAFLKSKDENEVIQKDLSIDMFRVISEWYHLAIYESVDLKDFKWNARSIAGKFGISVVEANQAMERLLRLELVQVDDGVAKKLNNHLLIESKLPNDAIRKHYRGILDKALHAIDSQSPNEKVAGTETFVFDVRDLQKVKVLTDEYFADLLKLSSKGKNKTEVYTSFVQVFRISQNQNKNSKGIV